jgi:phage baseplate assembly protein W
MRRLREQIRVNPIDTRPNVAVGIAIPFNGSTVFRSTYTTKDQTKSNLINWFLTNKGERIMNPNFGGDLRSFLFEQIPAFDQLKTYLEEQINAFFPQITIIDLEVNVEADDQIIEIDLSYSINNEQDNVRIQFAP